MNRIILMVVGMFICSIAFGQELSVPQNNPFQTNRASFRPPTESELQSESELQEHPGNPGSVAPENKAPENKAPENKAPENKGRSPSIRTVSIQETVEPNIPQPNIPQPSFLRPKTEQQPSLELPSPSVETQSELTTDDEVYHSIRHNNSMGVSNYRVAVAKERARARRMRMEAKKWYGIDSARPAVAPRGYLPTYSAYYNGIFSRPGYQYNYGASFYFHVPIAR